MIRRWRQGVLLAAVAAVAVAGVLLATQAWSGEEIGGQATEYRACNVVYEVPPESSPLEVFPIAMPPFNDGKPSLIVGMKQARLIYGSEDWRGEE